MEFDFADVAAPDRYKLMSAAITPRPIAWLTTLSPEGVRNAAPYSFFNMMGAAPPLVAVGLMRQPDGSYKDSARNVLETGEFVVNLVSEQDAPAMNFTCIDAPPEFDELGEVLRFHISDDAIDADRLHVDALAMHLVGRMHGAGQYTRCNDLFHLARPTYADYVAATAMERES